MAIGTVLVFTMGSAVVGFSPIVLQLLHGAWCEDVHSYSRSVFGMHDVVGVAVRPNVAVE